MLPLLRLDQRMRWLKPGSGKAPRRTMLQVVPTLLLLCAVLAWAAASQWLGRSPWKGVHDARQNARLNDKLAGLQPTPPSTRQGCAGQRAARPLVLLALGQSNAGNHGAPTPGGSPSVTVMTAGVCTTATDPLPGATGHDGSIWSLLPAALTARGLGRPVLLQVLAVEGTTVDDWTRDGSPLRQRLLHTLAANAATGITPDLVLWQLGEADAQANTSASHYARGLKDLAAVLHGNAVDAPVMLALSTVCRSGPHAVVRAATQDVLRQDRRFAAGPDTDATATRRDGCHFDLAGRQRAAADWAAAIGRQLELRPGGGKP